MNKLRLKWKIFAYLLGFCALLLGILWLFQTVLLDAFYRNIKVSEIKKEAGVVAANIGNENLDELIEQIAEQNDIRIDVMDVEAMEQADPYAQDTPHIQSEVSYLIALAQENGGEYYEYHAPPMPAGFVGMEKRPYNMQSLRYVKLAETADGQQLAISISAVISPVNATVTTLRYQLYVVSGIMILLSIVLAFIIAKRVSKPIEDISRSARSLAKGDYDTHFGGKGFYEIAELSDTLNTAAHELGRVEGLRRELLANVSHDLRTPLALIFSYAEMMHDFPKEVTPEQSQVIMDETKRLSSLVNDAMDLSKLEADMEQYSPARFNLTQSIADTTERMQALLAKEAFEITFAYDDEIFVYADEIKISRAFYNLLINAVNYSGDCRTVTVEQTRKGNRVRISVADGGEGIAEADLPSIWDRYYKSGKNHKRAVTGTGLGLSIVKKIIERHNGTYGVSSEYGKGSSFWFELPID